MFGRTKKKSRKNIVHTPRCTAIHEAMLMSLYLGYGAPSAPLFIPSGGLVCTCGDEDGGATTGQEIPPPQERNLSAQRILITV